jgi:CubicO group peptidase (beta-lactamase class C family)
VALAGQIQQQHGVELDAFAEATHTDAMIVVHGGSVVWEYDSHPSHEGWLHSTMSCSKSICGVLAGILADHKIIDPDGLVCEYVPELGDTSFEDATIRHLLDMTAGTAFSEEYMQNDEPVLSYVRRVHNERRHGEVFNYRTILTDLLAQVLERAAGTPYAELVSRKIWKPLGAEQHALLMLDPDQRPYEGAKIIASPQDLARFAMMCAAGGVLPCGERLVSEEWLAESWKPDRRAVLRFRESPYLLTKALPGGWYRNQWWGLGRGAAVAVGLGLYGQLCMVHRASGTAVVKLSSWPDPDDAALMRLQLDTALRIVRVLHGGQRGVCLEPD